MRRAAGIVALSVLSACSNESDLELTGACNSTRDCSFETICEVTTGRCIPEPVGAIAGGFRCRVVDSASEQDVGEPDFIGTVGDTRYVLAGFGSCTRSSWLDRDLNAIETLDITGSIIDGGFTALFVTIPLEPRPGSYPLGAPDFPFMASSATMTKELAAGDSYLAYSSAGSVELFQAPTAGNVISGYLSVDMTPVPGPASPMAPCETLADCGSQGTLGSPPEKSCIPDNTGANTCFVPCDDDSACAPYGSTCDMGISECNPSPPPDPG